MAQCGRARILAAGALILLIRFHVLALDPEKSLDQYVISAWTVTDGLPQNTINAIAQTEDGYLWFGTLDGLARFNGKSFKVFDSFNTPSFKTSVILRLCKTRDGSLWIGCDVGGLVRYKNGIFTRLEIPEIFPGNLSIQALAEDRRGNLWIGTDDNRLFLKEGKAFKPLKLPASLAPNDLRHLRCDDQDRLWIATRSGLFIFQRGRFRRLTRRDGLSTDNISVTCTDQAGNVWIGTEGGGLNLLQGEQVQHFGTQQGLPSSDVISLYEDTQGNLWAGTRGGLCRIRDGRATFLNTKDGLTNNIVFAINEDHEGSLWLGTSLGVNRLRDGRVVTVGTADGLPSDFVWSIYEDPGHALWIGTQGFGLVRYANRERRVFTVRDGLPSNVVRCTLLDRQGRFWIGTLGGLSLWDRGKKRIFTTDQGLAHNLVRAVFEDAAGTIWIGTANGLNVFREGRLSRYPLAGMPQPVVVYSIFQDQQGQIWIATRHGALRIAKDRLQVLDERNGFTGSSIYSFLQDRAGRMWLGTNTGLALLVGNRLHFFDKRDGLPDTLIYKIFEDGADNLVMSSNKGIIILSIGDLFDHLAGRRTELQPELLGLQDGMKTPECNGGSQTAGWLGHNGKIYIPTLGGMAIFTPGRKSENRIVPPVKIEEVLADGRPLDATAPIRLAPGTRRIEFRFAALSFLAPEKVKFKFRLEGLDPDWTDSGNRHEAFYTNIPPGEYRFRVIACNNDGVWNNYGDSFFFRLKPFFYQTAWFYVACGLIVLWSGFALYRLRVRQLKAREKYLSSLVEKRTHELNMAMEELERLSLTDSLTQLPNRRNFELILAQEWKRCSRESQPLSLMMIDIDLFKLYNDTYGHLQGDKCLKKVATSIHHCTSRAGDFVARLGGEEFVIILPNTHPRGASLMAERVRSEVERLSIPHSASAVGPFVTISIGVTTLVPDREKESDVLIAAADTELYKAKKAGRNRIQVAGEEIKA